MVSATWCRPVLGCLIIACKRSVVDGKFFETLFETFFKNSKLVCGVIGIVVCMLNVTCSVDGSEGLSISPKGDLVASAGEGGQVQIRSLASGEEVLTFQHDGVPKRGGGQSLSTLSWKASAVFSPDGTTLASSCATLPVKLWEVKTGVLLQSFANTGVGCDLVFSADGARLIGSGMVDMSGKQRLTLWDTKTGEVLREVTVDIQLGDAAWKRDCIQAKFASSGPMLLIDKKNGDERSLRVWNTMTNKETLVVEMVQRSSPQWCLSPDGKTLVIRESSRNGEIGEVHEVFQTTTGKRIQQWSAGTPGK